MYNPNDEPAASTNPARVSWREAIGVPLRNRRPLMAAEFLFILLPFALRALGAIRNASLLLLLIGWLSLWLRGVGWRGVGLGRPTNWWRTILLGIGIGIAYDAVDIFAFLPALHRLTGQAVQVEQYGALRGNLGAVLLLLALTWTLAAFGEELAYRGYALNRIADLLGRGPAAFALSALVVSVMFGFAHVSQGVSGVLDNILAGAMFSALYVASGRNLWLPIIVHGVVDTTSLVLLFFGFSPK
jgi:uncharacterized protein